MEKPDETAAAAALAAATELHRLAPGPLAQLRRMNGRTAGPMFWRLAARYPRMIGSKAKQGEWVAILRILATLTEKGDPDQRRRLHDADRPLGEVLCDGGTRDNWPSKGGGEPRPVFSESRLLQLLSARGPQRAVLLERAARALVRSREPGCGINVVDIAFAVLRPADSRRLAEPYYRRLDRAELAAAKSEEGRD